MGNIDETAYSTIPDWKIPLTRRGERQALKAAHDLATLIKGETLFAYCSPYKRAKETWEIIAKYLRDEEENVHVDVIGMREEPRIAEQQFGNFQNPHKVRTAKSERRMFGRFFFRFPNGEAGLDVYNRVSSFLATLSRDIRQLDELYSIQHQNDTDSTTAVSSSVSTRTTTPNRKDAMETMNILVVCHGLTLRLLLMRYFQLTVEEFENSYNSQNAKLVVMDRFVDKKSGREFYRLHEEAKQALNLKGDVSNEKPVYWRMGDNENAAAVDRGLLLFDEEDVDIEE